MHLCTSIDSIENRSIYLRAGDMAGVGCLFMGMGRNTLQESFRLIIIYCWPSQKKKETIGKLFLLKKDLFLLFSMEEVPRWLGSTAAVPFQGHRGETKFFSFFLSIGRKFNVVFELGIATCTAYETTTWM